jgi:hypothetical protein
MSARISKNSRLRYAPLVKVDGYEFWDLLVVDDIPVRSDEIQYTVQMTDRIDLLANKFYGDPVLWWVLAVANSMEILPTDLKFGAVLRVPSRAYVYAEILGRQVPVF